MEQQERETLDKIFNQSTITIDGKVYPLRFTVLAEMWLENNGGICLHTLAKNMATRPTETVLRLAFAGLPREEFREKVAFERFVESLSEQDARDITHRVSWILECYFNHLLGELDKMRQVSEKGSSVKKN